MLDYFMDGEALRVPRADLRWQSTPGVFLGSDNLDVASCYAVAFNVAKGVPLAGGAKAIVPFTVAGGAPAFGATVWIASSQDDGGTGRAHATATLPSTAIAPLVFPSQIAIAGVCASTVNFGSALHPQYLITVAATIAPTNGALPADAALTFNGVQFTPQGTCSFSCAVATTNQVDLLDNQSIVVTLVVDDINSAIDRAFRCLPPDLSTGYLCYSQTGNGVLVFDPRGGGADLLGSMLPGRLVIAVSRHGGFFHYSVAGQNVQTSLDTGGDGGPLAVFAFEKAFGLTTAAIKLNRALSDAELMNASTSQITFAQGTNPFAPSATLFADLACQWKLDLTSYVGGVPHAIPGPAGAAFDFTVTGAPTIRTTTLNYRNAPAAIALDGPTPTYGNGNIATTRAAMRWGFTVAKQSDFAMVAAGYNNTDVDNSDEGGVSFLINGKPITWLNGAPDGITRPLNFVGNMGGVFTTDPISTWTTIAPPYHVEVLTGDKIPRIDSFTSGANVAQILIPSTAVMDPATTANLLVITSDGNTIGNHGDDAVFSCPLSGAVISRIRADFPGQVLGIDIMPNWSFMLMKQWGDGTVVPWAKYVVAAAKATCPAGVRTYTPLMGLNDWGANVPIPTFVADYGLYIDTIHALDPGANVALLQDPHTTLYPTANGNGDLLSTFATVSTPGLLAGRPWVTASLDVTGPTAVIWTVATFFRTPPLPAGPPALKGNIKTAIHSVLPGVY